MASPVNVSFVRNAAMIRNGGSSLLLQLLHMDGRMHGRALNVLLFDEAEVIAEPNRPRAKLITEIPETEIQGARFSAFLTGSVVPTLLEPGKVKVKPYPDPYRVSKHGTKVIAQYMTARELKAQTDLPTVILRSVVHRSPSIGQKFAQRGYWGSSGESNGRLCQYHLRGRHGRDGCH
jgi:hypothetical protein